jgi:DNA-binding XRE family transcriptional regulator
MTPKNIKKLRTLTGKTQVEAAADVHVTARTWQNWEASKKVNNSFNMPEGLIELFCIKNKITYPPKLK